jgi:hypothetical protein
VDHLRGAEFGLTLTALRLRQSAQRKSTALKLRLGANGETASGFLVRFSQASPLGQLALCRI